MGNQRSARPAGGGRQRRWPEIEGVALAAGEVEVTEGNLAGWPGSRLKSLGACGHERDRPCNRGAGRDLASRGVAPSVGQELAGDGLEGGDDGVGLDRVIHPNVFFI
jgi:hypothetical protein